ncbi:hypothetical protein ACU635_50260 [[Actinomadura] parvosata]|uniref:hypothetical protein n=1 Tax=[Actinomadura] parvosata TaxID=1955412 RepID=UPI00406CF169
MTQPPDEYGDLLRRALRAEADAVVPSPEGLEIIRARIQRRGVRNLFWWRAGAAGVGAVLVAGAIVMAVPNLRSQIIEQTVAPAGDSSSEVPSNSSTTRSHQPPAKEPPPQQSQPVVVVPESSAPPSPKPTRKAGSTSRPSPSPAATPTPSDCPSPQAEQPADCPEGSPSPTPTAAETTGQPSACPIEECPPPDEVTETPTELASPLLDSSQTTP